jgi:hypothetical protein
MGNKLDNEKSEDKRENFFPAGGGSCSPGAGIINQLKGLKGQYGLALDLLQLPVRGRKPFWILWMRGWIGYETQSGEMPPMSDRESEESQVLSGMRGKAPGPMSSMRF